MKDQELSYYRKITIHLSLIYSFSQLNIVTIFLYLT